MSENKTYDDIAVHLLSEFIGETVEILAYFPYDTSIIYCEDQLFRFGSDHGDGLDELHKGLAKLAGKTQDNKQSFVIRKGRSVIGVHFHDWTVTFGTVTVKNVYVPGEKYRQCVRWDKVEEGVIGYKLKEDK